MAEVRTTSATGGQKGVKPERFSLMPRRGLEAIARVFGFGAEKYAAHNWRRKYEWSKSFDALERHMQAAKDGETYDPESGLPHLAHAGFHILVLLTWLEEDGEGVDNPFDDRWPTAMERMRLEGEAVEAREAEEGWIPEPVWTAAVADEQQDWAGWEQVGYITADGLAESAGFKRPNVQAIGVEWRDPAPMTVQNSTQFQQRMNEILNDLVNPVRPIRFIAGIDGKNTEDVRAALNAYHNRGERDR